MLPLCLFVSKSNRLIAVSIYICQYIIMTNINLRISESIYMCQYNILKYLICYKLAKVFII